MRRYFLFLSVLFLFSFAGVSTKKRISDAYYRYEFYTINKVISPNEGREYFWYKGGTIHSTENGVAGELLHNDFAKFYHSNQLAQAGTYKNGLKEGYWKTWFENGTLQSKTYYNSGQKDGKYDAYDQTGFLTETGKYSNNKKEGRWINYISKDTLKYNNGLIVAKKDKKATRIKDSIYAKQAKPGFIKRLFSNNKKNKSNTNKPANNAPKIEKKVGFFKRLFAKKEKLDTTKSVKEKNTIPKTNNLKPNDKGQ